MTHKALSQRGVDADQTLRDNRMALRGSTREMHDRAERQWGAAADGDFDLHAFFTVMQTLHHTGIRAAEITGLAGARDHERARLDALSSDLGSDVHNEDPMVISSPDAAWGMLYTLNGSALGASLLLKSGVTLAGKPSAYLELMRDYARSGALNSFFHALNSQELDFKRARQGACQIFSAMIEQTDQKGPPHGASVDG